ncbi:MAG: DNA-3-methyladenine glycosylase [Prosthecochloris sp.]|nr:DNA-3-methyladenine glycosylase [Prosthecochloris sp.]
MQRVSGEFFNMSALEMAAALLGMVMTHELSPGVFLRGRIVETEAYLGSGDEACHASRRKTKRNSVMFGPPGTLYVYFTYGNHYLLNIVTEPEGVAGAVLLRAMEPLEGIGIMRQHRGRKHDHELMNGPGKLTRALGLTLEHNGTSLLGGPVFLEKGTPVRQEEISTSPRIGISKSTELPWRKFITGHPCVSKGRIGPPVKKKKRILES